MKSRSIKKILKEELNNEMKVTLDYLNFDLE